MNNNSEHQSANQSCREDHLTNNDRDQLKNSFSRQESRETASYSDWSRDSSFIKALEQPEASIPDKDVEISAGEEEKIIKERLANWSYEEYLTIYTPEGQAFLQPYLKVFYKVITEYNFVNECILYNKYKDPQPPTKYGEEEDTIIICDRDELAKLFFRGLTIVWYNPDADSKETKDRIERLSEIGDVKVFSTWNKATEYILGSNTACQVISSGKDGEILFKTISKKKNVLSIYLYSKEDNMLTEWAKSNLQVTSIEEKFGNLLSKLHKDSLRSDFPAFAPVFDDADTTKMNKLHFFLKHYVDFRNRQQAKDDFLALARSVYRDTKNMNEFAAHYNEYDLTSIFTWYTRESFLYKVVNNCLRIASSDSILYVRLIIRDLELAIKELFQLKSRNYDGLLYRGAFLSNDEWSSLERNIGKEIEMFGFLSSSKDKEVALRFIKRETAKKVFITIIVPASPSKDEQGFAEVDEFSEYAENEVLFNVRSKFTVLETTQVPITGSNEVCRHVILLYGAGSMRNYISKSSPKIDILCKREIDKTVCDQCHCEMTDSTGSQLLFIELGAKNEQVCSSCMNKSENKRLSSYLCLSSKTYSNKLQIPEAIKVQGFSMQYRENLDIPFFGYKCIGKNHKKDVSVSRYFTCVECSQTKKTWCGHCFDTQNGCLRQSHKIIMENSPYTFWCEAMSINEKTNLEYQEEVTRFHKGFEQGEILWITENFEKARLYCEKKLTKIASVEALAYKIKLSYRHYVHHCFAISFSYDHFARVCLDSEDYETAISLCNKASRIAGVLQGPGCLVMAPIYNNMGKAYAHLKDYSKAKEFFWKAIKIKESFFGKNHLEVLKLRGNFGFILCQLGEYQHSVEIQRECVDALEKEQGKQRRHIASTYSNLAKAYSGLKEHQKAVELALKGLEINKAVFGEEHTFTANAYSDVGSAYHNMQNYAKCNTFFLRALEICQKISGERNQLTGTLYNNIGNAYMQTGDKENATKYLTLAIKIIKEDTKNTSPIALCGIYNNLGHLLRDKGDYENAIGYHHKTLEIALSLYGEHHPKIADIYNQLVADYASAQDYDRAIASSLKCIKLKTKLLGEHTREIAILYNKHAGYCTKHQKYQEAIRFYSKSLQLAETLYGEYHEDVAKSYHLLAKAYLNNKTDLQRAVDLYSKAIKMRKSLSGEENSVLRVIEFEMRQASSALSKCRNAIEECERTLEFMKEAFGDQASETAEAYSNLADAYLELGDDEKAVELYSWSLELIKLIHGEKDPKTINLYEKLSYVYFNLEDHDEAFELYSKGLTVARETLGDDNPELLQLYERFADECYFYGEYQRSKEILAQIGWMKEKQLKKKK